MTDKTPNPDYKVADLSLAEAGRHQIRLAEHEMPGLMAMRREYARAKPLAGARIAGSLHMTVQTAVLIETLVALGAQVRWVSCNIFSTQDEAAAAVVVGPNGTPDRPAGTPVFAWKGETLEEYWWCTDQLFRFPDGAGAEHDRRRRRRRDRCSSTRASSSSGRRGAGADGRRPPGVRGVAAHAGREPRRRTRPRSPRWRPRSAASARRPPPACTGSTGSPRDGELLFPAINVNDSVTKSKFDNKYGIRHSLVDGLNRATDVMLAGKLAVVCGYGDVGKGAAEALRGQGARVVVTEIDPICALQAAMDGLPVVRLEDVVATADVFITTTGNRDMITAAHLAAMKHNAIVGNVGHFDNEIDMAGLAAVPGIVRSEIKPQVDEWTFPDGHAVIVLSEGRLMNLGNATGHPSFVMSELVHQPGDRPARAVHEARAVRTRRAPAAEAPGREGGPAAPRRARRPADRADQGTGGVSRRGRRRARTSPSTTGTEEVARPPLAAGPPNFVTTRSRRTRVSSAVIRRRPSGTGRPRSRPTTTAKPSRMPICGSTRGRALAAHHHVEHAVDQVPQRQRLRDRLQPGRRALQREERAGQERHRQHDQVGHRAGRLRRLGERPGQQPDRQERQRAGDDQRDRHPPVVGQLQPEERQRRDADEDGRLHQRDARGSPPTRAPTTRAGAHRRQPQPAQDLLLPPGDQRQRGAEHGAGGDRPAEQARA